MLLLRSGWANLSKSGIPSSRSGRRSCFLRAKQHARSHLFLFLGNPSLVLLQQLVITRFPHANPVTVQFTGPCSCLLLTDFSSFRDDSNPVCMSGHIPGWPLGEEAQPVCSGSHQDGHAGEPGVHSLLRVFPVPGLRHRTCGRGYCSLWKQVSPQRVSGSFTNINPCYCP